jgi:hypothetical protein
MLRSLAIVSGWGLGLAASFHHVDILLFQTALGLRWNRILEMGKINHYRYLSRVLALTDQ